LEKGHFRYFYFSEAKKEKTAGIQIRIVWEVGF